MTNKKYSLITGIVFLVIAIVHGLRVVFGWEANIGGQPVPMWSSWIATIFTGLLAYKGLRLSRRP